MITSFKIFESDDNLYDILEIGEYVVWKSWRHYVIGKIIGKDEKYKNVSVVFVTDDGLTKDDDLPIATRFILFHTKSFDDVQRFIKRQEFNL